jgi:hypothetical protein
MRFACLIEFGFFGEPVRERLAAHGIAETFADTKPAPDSAGPARVSVLVPAETEAEADVQLIRALRGRVEFERVSSWAYDA